jgi:energy-coupling factor transporter ATP-binding protein EcfA2
MTDRQEVTAAPPWADAGGAPPAGPGSVDTRTPVAVTGPGSGPSAVGADQNAAGFGLRSGENGQTLDPAVESGPAAPERIDLFNPVRPARRAPEAEQPGGDLGQPSVGPAGPAASQSLSPPASTPADPVPAGSAGQADEPYARVDARKLEAALLGLRKPMMSVRLPLEAPAVAQARAERLKLLSQIDDYLLPRLRQSGAPILVALVGSTGAGKSTLLNSLAGRQVSATGIRRPTTNSPVLACHPNDMRWFAENVFLPTLPRVRQQGLAMPGRDGLLVLAATDGMPEGVAVLDTPDIDSVVKAHRDFAHQFLDASDLWLFVTTARRYADAAVWDMLKDARDRGAALAIALSRVPQPAIRELTIHFDAMLEANGLRDVPRFLIPETVVTDAMLPPEIAVSVQDYLADTAGRVDRRVAVLTQTMAGVLDTFRDRVPALADRVTAQLTIRSQLWDNAEAAYAEQLADFDAATRNGSLVQGEVLARWQDFAGTGDLLKTLQVKRGRGARKKPRLPDRAAALKVALDASLLSLIAVIADEAAEHAVAAWQQDPAGAALLEGQGDGQQSVPLAARAQSDFIASALADLGLTDGSAGQHAVSPADLPRSSPALAERAARAVSDWQDHLMHLVRQENVTKRSVARVVSFDDESLATILAVAVLSPAATGQMAASETTTAPQRLLTSLFGAAPLREVGARARQDLHDRVSLLLRDEARRFLAMLDAVGAPDEAMAGELLQAGFTLEGAR